MCRVSLVIFCITPHHFRPNAFLLLTSPQNSMAEAAAAAAEGTAEDKYRGHKRPHELIPSHIRDKKKIDVS